MPIRTTLIIVLLGLGVFSLGQAIQSIWAAQMQLNRASAVTETLPNQSKLRAISDLLAEERLHVYGLLASSKKVRAKHLPAIEETFATRDATRSGLIASLEDPALEATVQRLLGDLGELRTRAMEEAQKSSMVRDLSFATAWLDGLSSMINSIGLIQNGALPPSLTLDPVMARYQAALAAAEMAKKHQALEAVLMGGFIASRGHLSMEKGLNIASHYERTQTDLERLLVEVQNTADGQLATTAAQVAALNAQPQAILRKAVMDFVMDGGDRPEDATLPIWLDYSAQANAAMVQIASDLQMGLNTHVQTLAAREYQTRTIAILIGVPCVAIIAAALILVARSILSPLSRAVAHISSLADGNLDVDASDLSDKHEIGRLRQALEKLLAVSRDVERLNAENAQKEAENRAAERKAAEDERARVQADQERAATE